MQFELKVPGWNWSDGGGGGGHGGGRHARLCNVSALKDRKDRKG